MPQKKFSCHTRENSSAHMRGSGGRKEGLIEEIGREGGFHGEGSFFVYTTEKEREEKEKRDEEEEEKKEEE